MNSNSERRVLVLAKVGRDGSLICQTLAHAGIDAQLCGDTVAVQREILQGAAAVVLTPEALGAGGVDPSLRRNSQTAILVRACPC